MRRVVSQQGPGIQGLVHLLGCMAIRRLPRWTGLRVKARQCENTARVTLYREMYLASATSELERACVTRQLRDPVFGRAISRRGGWFLLWQQRYVLGTFDQHQTMPLPSD
jgi:hypothetical protein